MQHLNDESAVVRTFVPARVAERISLAGVWAGHDLECESADNPAMGEWFKSK